MPPAGEAKAGAERQGYGQGIGTGRMARPCGRAVVMVVALIACGFYLASAALLASLELQLRWRDMLWQTISAHALGPGRFRFDLYGGLMIGGVLSQALATALHGGLGWGVPAGLCVLAAMLGGLLLFPTDSHGVEPGHHPVRARQREGFIHLYFAMGCFAAAGVIVLLGEPKMGLLVSGPMLKLLDWVAIVVAAMLTMLAVTGFWRPLQAWFGLAERGFFYSSAVWFILTALALAFGHPPQ